MSESEESPETPPDDAAAGDTALLAEIASLDEELAAAVGDRLERLEEEIETLEDKLGTAEEELETVENELETAENELETVEERLEHTRADFRNYKERAKRRQDEIRERATEDLIERLLEVRDNLGRALADESGDVDSLREGVELTRKQFDRVFEEENVERIDPDPGTDVDANRHEVMMQVESDQPAETIHSVYRPGYEMAGKILRPAQVTVAERTAEENAESGGDSATNAASENESESEPASGDESETDSDAAA
ncbi:MAG: nucleotide exchange factor GrpE [Halodesulfurarchaeum sp.]